MKTPPPAPRSPVPGHVAWVARPSGTRRDSPELDERALLALAETALDLGVRWLTIQDPTAGHALRVRATALARRGVAVAEIHGTAADAAAGGARGPTDLVGVEGPSLRVLLAGERTGRRELVGAVRELAARGVAAKKVREATIAGVLAVPDVDLLVLTGGDRRVPDLLVWQVAYSEIVVLPDAWPAVGEAQFLAALSEYRRRDRRYGGLVAPG